MPATAAAAAAAAAAADAEAEAEAEADAMLEEAAVGAAEVSGVPSLGGVGGKWNRCGLLCAIEVGMPGLCALEKGEHQAEAPGVIMALSPIHG